MAIGNTTVFNRKTRSLLLQAGPDVDAAVHDWWIYLVATASGGEVFYDPQPTVHYRIHSHNQIGANISRIKHGWMLLCRFHQWSDANMRALGRIEGMMLPEHRKTYERFRNSRCRSFLPRLYGLASAGVYRETALDNFGLLVAAAVGRI
jgi:hypothetical protein